MTVITFHFLIFLVGSKKTLGFATTLANSIKCNKEGSTTTTTTTWLISLEDIS